MRVLDFLKSTGVETSMGFSESYFLLANPSGTVRSIRPTDDIVIVNQTNRTPEFHNLCRCTVMRIPSLESVEK